MRAHALTSRANAVSPKTDAMKAPGPARPEVRQILHAPRPQAKLTVGAPDDAFEKEADQVADQVMRMPEPGVQRMCAECEEEKEDQGVVRRLCSECQEEMQAKEEPGQRPSVPAGFEQRFAALRGSGQPLSASERAFFEPRFGRDFSNVRLHSGSAASELACSVQARAFTLGDTVVLGAGETDRRLMAHELTHVVQQGGAAPAAVARKPLARRAPTPYIARACSPKKISANNTGNGTQGYALGPILSTSSVRYRYDLRYDVTGDINDCDLGTKIAALMEDWSPSKVDYYINAKKSVKADYDDATTAWTENKEKFIDDYTKSKLVGVEAPRFITESGTTYAKVADGPGGNVASWATGALVRYTVIAWIKGSDGKELSLRFWVTLWATRPKAGDAFTAKYMYTSNLPGSVTA